MTKKSDIDKALNRLRFERRDAQMEKIQLDQRIEQLDLLISALAGPSKRKPAKSGLILIDGGGHCYDPEPNLEIA